MLVFLLFAKLNFFVNDLVDDFESRPLSSDEVEHSVVAALAFLLHVNAIVVFDTLNQVLKEEVLDLVKL